MCVDVSEVSGDAQGFTPTSPSVYWSAALILKPVSSDPK